EPPVHGGDVIGRGILSTELVQAGGDQLRVRDDLRETIPHGRVELARGDCRAAIAYGVVPHGTGITRTESSAAVGVLDDHRGPAVATAGVARPEQRGLRVRVVAGGFLAVALEPISGGSEHFGTH